MTDVLRKLHKLDFTHMNSGRVRKTSFRCELFRKSNPLKQHFKSLSKVLNVVLTILEVLAFWLTIKFINSNNCIKTPGSNFLVYSQIHTTYINLYLKSMGCHSCLLRNSWVKRVLQEIYMYTQIINKKLKYRKPSGTILN